MEICQGPLVESSPSFSMHGTRSPFGKLATPELPELLWCVTLAQLLLKSWSPRNVQLAGLICITFTLCAWAFCYNFLPYCTQSHRRSDVPKAYVVVLENLGPRKWELWGDLHRTFQQIRWRFPGNNNKSDGGSGGSALCCTLSWPHAIVVAFCRVKWSNFPLQLHFTT